jgi:hypothetical protein
LIKVSLLVRLQVIVPESFRDLNQTMVRISNF